MWKVDVPIKYYSHQKNAHPETKLRILGLTVTVPHSAVRVRVVSADHKRKGAKR
jgi:hypothetical protein